MYKVTEYPNGTFSWADCNSTDVDKTKAFYAQLFGWTTEDVPMGDNTFYTFFKKDGETVSAVSPMQPEMQQQGVPSFWSNYVTVDDVDAMVSKITDLGGTVIAPPFDVFDSGRMLVLQDPTGAALSLWQPKTHIGASLVNVPGAMSWNELLTHDLEKAKDFYGKLFGWEFHIEDGGYNTIMNNGRPNGGIDQITPQMGSMPPHWGTYFSVSDINAAVESVKKLGGSSPMPVITAPGIGSFTTIAEPTGAMCTIVQLEQAQPWTE